jgi:hypothetical protein
MSKESDFIRTFTPWKSVTKASALSVCWMITQVGKNFLLPVKIQGDSYSFDIAESEYDNQISLSPPPPL